MTNEKIEHIRVLLKNQKDVIDTTKLYVDEQTRAVVLEELEAVLVINEKVLALLSEKCRICGGSDVYEYTIVTGESIPIRCFHDNIKYPDCQ